MLLLGPLLVVAVLSGRRTLLKAIKRETDAHTDSTADTKACIHYFPSDMRTCILRIRQCNITRSVPEMRPCTLIPDYPQIHPRTHPINCEMAAEDITIVCSPLLLV